MAFGTSVYTNRAKREIALRSLDAIFLAQRERISARLRVSEARIVAARRQYRRSLSKDMPPGELHVISRGHTFGGGPSNRDRAGD